MRKKNICLNLATGLLLLSSLTACGVQESDINIPFVKSDSVEKSEEKEEEVIVNKDNLSGSFGESEEIKTDSMDINVEVEKEPEEDIVELEDNETVESESVAESDIENPFEEYGKKLVGVHQFDMFKGEIPSYLYYYGISKMSSNGIEMPMSIFLKPDFASSKELITVYNMDLGNQGLNEAGITINFSGLSDDMLNQYISSFGFEEMAPGEIISQKYVRYGDLAYLMIVYEDDGLYGTMGLTIENNLALFVMSASELSSDSSFKMFDDFLNSIEFNFESVEDELNYEAIDLELLLSSDSEKSLEEDSKDNKNIHLDNVMTYSMNGYDITLDKSSLKEVEEKFNISPQSFYKGSYSSSYTYEYDGSNYLELVTYPDSDIIFEMSVDYFDDADNVFQFDSIPFGTTYNDLVKAYGEPVYSSGDKYGGYYAWELTDNVELTVTTDEVKNNAKIMSVTVSYYNY